LGVWLEVWYLAHVIWIDGKLENLVQCHYVLRRIFCALGVMRRERYREKGWPHHLHYMLVLATSSFPLDQFTRWRLSCMCTELKVRSREKQLESTKRSSVTHCRGRMMFWAWNEIHRWWAATQVSRSHGSLSSLCPLRVAR
jgi:hypothetical protein